MVLNEVDPKLYEGFLIKDQARAIEMSPLDQRQIANIYDDKTTKLVETDLLINLLYILRMHVGFLHQNILDKERHENGNT